MANIRSFARFAGVALFTLVAQVAFAVGSLVFNNTPLFTDTKLPANLVLDTSVEWPTTLLAYRSVQSGNFSPTYQYIGYFDYARCYTYDSTNNEFLPSVAATIQLDGSGHITGNGYYCNDPAAGGALYSGNFMNWISMSAIDLYRQALTGGNRSVDTVTQTDLLRAYLYAGTDNGHGGMGVKNLSDGRPWLPVSLLVPWGSSSAQYSFWITNLDTHVIIYSSNPSGSSPHSVSRNIQVRVCDSLNSPAPAYHNESNCKQYVDAVHTTTSYKPVGELQNNAALLKVGLFTYRLDTNKYGGVMRSPVKYLGPNYYSIPQNKYFNNSRAEWSPSTGIFTTNPDSDWAANASVYTATKSGIINYVNGFGSAGNYKSYDPISTMTAEIARYYRGEEVATTSYTAGTTAAQGDGFPVIQNWNQTNPWKSGDPEYVAGQGSHDPIKYPSCQKNFIMVFGDDNTWGDNTYTSYPSFPDQSSTFISDLVNQVINMEMNQSGNVGGGLHVPQMGRLGDVEGSFGIAYWLNTSAYKYDSNNTSLYGQPGSSNYVPFRVKSYDVDVNETTSMPLNGRKSWMIAKYGGFEDKSYGSVAGDKNPNTTFSPSGSVITSQVEWFTPSNGYYDAGDGQGPLPIPNTYLPVFQPALMVTGIRSMFRSIAGESASTGSVASNTADLQSNSQIYRTGYQAGVWTGTLQSFGLTPTGQLAGAALWDAGSILTARNLSANPRTIISYNRGGTGFTGTTVAFNWNNLTTAKQTMLETDPVTTTVGTSTEGQNRLNYLAGTRTLELSWIPSLGGSFRDRSTLLGDIVDSSPTVFYASGSAAGIAVGANDGQLHIFDTSGNELLSYFPDATFGNVNLLTARNYAHQFFVDGSVNSYSDVDSSGNPRIFIGGGFGYGAPGVYSLDFTPFLTGNPGQATVQFEYTDKDDSTRMGYIFGEPQIVRMSNGLVALITGNGFNSTDGQGHFYIFFLEGSLAGTVTRIDTGAGSSSAPAGLAQPFVMVDSGTGKATALYAGDTQGNVWKLDVSNANPAVWQQASSLTKLYQALDPSGHPQPITTQVQVQLDTSLLNSSTGGASATPPTNAWVVVGTGKYLEPSDASTVGQQVETAYVLHDQGVALASGRSNLTQQTLDTTTPVTNNTNSTTGVGGVTYQLTTKNAKAAGTTPDGWYFDFPIAGERDITNPSVFYVANGVNTANWVLFPSFIPANTAVNACSVGGTGYWTVFELTTGAAPPRTYDSNGDGTFDANDTNGNRKSISSVGLTVLGQTVVRSGKPLDTKHVKDCKVTAEGANDSAQLGICGGANTFKAVSWREILD